MEDWPLKLDNMDNVVIDGLVVSENNKITISSSCPISLGNTVGDLIDTISKLEDRIEALESTVTFLQIKKGEPMNK